MTQDLHVVFGAGQIGPRLAALLRERGHAVRLVRRSGPGPEGIETRHGDAGDPAFAAEAAAGAAAVYHCMNPAYFEAEWARELPRFASSLVAAAGRAGARLVVLDNVYMLGRPKGRPLDEDSPVAPCSRKGEIRARVNEFLVAAHAKGDARVVVGRASDFYGPGGTGTYFGDAFWPGALGKGVAQAIARLDTPHTYHYTLDVVAGLAALGEAPDDVTGRWWMLPAAPAESSAAMIARIGRALGRELKTERIPGFVLGALSLFMPIMRELREMGYQWDEPFTVNDARFRARFPGVAATPLDAGVAAMTAWAKEHYAAKK
jgi:nucleoside-diphosphate-sugar epimerase